MQSLRSVYNPIHIITGLSIWGIWFIALYGGQSVACSVAPPPLDQGPWNWLNLALAVLSLLTAGLLLALARLFLHAARRPHCSDRERFVASVSSGSNLIGAIAVAFMALPIMALPPCA
ncbi:hypothetical protein DNK06_23740 [Pseudomonas daroniae]|uniref:DUF2269 domain-containing protein n=1 Tax=Phytopseudomonas daroniae TaxID=2487519 RepID=A0A4Q9QGN7_9GAMM|nr:MULTISPECIES: hypothetical protein [Pseudomonas]TBU71574.1 hypothetical protein DNK06_23740 [Pseudomonas daroniae]TBU72991.1 hypothetical protein DNK10_20170 [Pseudomonas daroniae]TBU74950.1 hypothetical protein DNK31_23255 [Pseudomonas sp. FRB 228]TBU86907.1 hypothetical protein DNJ99_23235 [Pseudomonas daroniae]